MVNAAAWWPWQRQLATSARIGHQFKSFSPLSPRHAETHEEVVGVVSQRLHEIDGSAWDVDDPCEVVCGCRAKPREPIVHVRNTCQASITHFVRLSMSNRRRVAWK